MSLNVNINNKKKDILILGKGPTQGLDNTTLAAEKEYSINCTEQQKKLIYLLMENKSVNRKQNILR